MVWVYACASLLLLAKHACATELLGEYAGIRVHSPAASEWSGPIKPDFRVNTSATNAPLVYAGEYSEFCDESSPEIKKLIEGKTVLVPLRVATFFPCPLPQAYANLVKAGSRNAIMYISQVDMVPGKHVYSRGWSNRKLFDSKNHKALFLEVSRQDGIMLRGLLSKVDAPPVYMLLSPDENAWQDWYGNWFWVLILRLLIPAGYVSVMVVAVKVAATGYSWGTTKAWVLWLELIPAAVLAVAHAMGIGYYDSLSIPLTLHAAFLTRFSLCELLTTILMCRFWHEHAKSMLAQGTPATVDPQKKGWAGRALCAFLLLVEAVTMALILSRNTSLVLAFLYLFLLISLEMVSLVYICWSCGRVLCYSQSTATSGSDESHWWTAIYLSASMGFVALAIGASSLTVIGFLRGTRISPAWFFTASVLVGVARIGTALCQLWVFLPTKQMRQQRLSNRPPAMDTHLLKGAFTMIVQARSSLLLWPTPQASAARSIIVCCAHFTVVADTAGQWHAL